MCYFIFVADSFQKLKIVFFTLVFFDLRSDFGIFDPRYMVLHVSVYVKSRVSDRLNANFDVALFDVHDCLFHGFGHFKSLHNYWEPASAKMCNVDLLALIQALSRVYQAHFV